MRILNQSVGSIGEGLGCLPTAVYSGAAMSRTEAAAADLIGGLRRWRLCVSLSWLDIKQRYRRAVLGPFWITISMSVLVGALGTVYPVLFNQDVRSFLPFLASGVIVWNFCTSTIIESTTAFVHAEGLIKQGGMPLSLHLLRMIVRNSIINAHHIVVMCLVYIWQPSLLDLKMLLFIPGLVLILANFTWIAVVISILGTRFRDLSPIIANMLQVLFFLTPVMYRAELLPAQLSFIYLFNPLYYLIEVVRGPMLGTAPPRHTYSILLLLAIGGWLLAFALFRRMRARIPYWL